MPHQPGLAGAASREGSSKRGLRPLHFHGLRHSFASQLVAAGIGLADVQKALGHVYIEMKARRLHARRVHDQAAAFLRVQSGTTFADEALATVEPLSVSRSVRLATHE